ncbi:MAG: hypothetical protein H5T62_13760 [Anaerolineae bacterium]|nr:hypothetical protein [Anaerolineae bacterium]
MAVRKRYYFITWVEEEALGIGYAEEGYQFDFLSEGRYYPDWEPVLFTLKDGGYADYQANDLGWPLCSEKLKRIIEQHALPDDNIQWLAAKVVGPGGEQRDYYILHLSERPDVLDKERTLFAEGDVVVKPYFSAKAIGSHRVFSFHGGQFRVIVSAEIRDAILSANCTGIDFYEARIV